jgi:uncharacterized protein with HEPN domain
MGHMEHVTLRCHVAQVEPHRREERNVTVNDPTSDLEVVLENIARIERFVAGCDEESFRNNEQAVFAVQYASLLMRAAVDRLGEWTEVFQLEVPWRDRAAAGTELTPADGLVDPGAVWQMITTDLARLQWSAMVALNQLEGNKGVESR